MMCPSCGGTIGRDCFNPGECILIGQAKAAAYDAQPCDFGELLAERDRLKAELEELSIDRLARELDSHGLGVALTRLSTTWYCELRNNKLGFFPQGFGLTAIEAVEEAASHPKVKEILE